MDSTYRTGRFLTAGLASGNINRNDLDFWAKLHMSAPDLTEQAFAGVPASRPDSDTIHDLAMGTVGVRAAAEQADDEGNAAYAAMYPGQA